MKLICIFLAILCVSSVSAQDQYKNIYSVNAWKARDKWQRADELIKFLNISPGSHVADIGCNEGYMSIKLARVVKTGKVYAVDVSKSKLEKLRSLSKKRKVSNIEIIKGDYDNPKLPSNKLDAVIILDTYHEMNDHDKILLHVKAALKPGGRLLICEPIADERRRSVRADQEKKHEVAMKFVLEDLTKAGFKITYQKDPFLDRTKEKGDKMWIVVATRN